MFSFKMEYRWIINRTGTLPDGHTPDLTITLRAKAEALASNLQLVELTKAERWDGVLPTTMLPNNTIPFLDAKK